MRFNAKPPDEHKWESGKTAATVRFVRQAEDLLQRQTALDAPTRKKLKDKIKKLKEGHEVLTEWLTVEDFLSAS